jgi:pimeloyl-ACP methyl ester carboxylesterase
METIQKTLRSKDGTIIAYEELGTGAVIILVDAALADRKGSAKLAKALAPNFRVISYDRRGRGKSGNTLPYAVDREVEDIESLIDASGGLAYLFGSSSGSVLALDATSKLNNKVKGLFMYEPPFIVDDSFPAMPPDFAEQIESLLAVNRLNDAVKLFFHKGMGIPSIFVTLMRWLMPDWSSMVKVAHTIPYDLAILGGTQASKPLPANRWTTATAPIRVMVGSKSEAFFHNGAKALTELLSNAQYRSLEGRDHGAVLMAAPAIASEVKQFFLS